MRSILTYRSVDRGVGVLVLGGTKEFETSDGSIRRVSVGDVMLVEDTLWQETYIAPS
jgi:hypothetical protein